MKIFSFICDKYKVVDHGIFLHICKCKECSCATRPTAVPSRERLARL